MAILHWLKDKRREIGLSLAVTASLLLALEAALRLMGLAATIPEKRYYGLQASLVYRHNPGWVPAAEGSPRPPKELYGYKPHAAWRNGYPDNPRGYFDGRNMVSYRINNLGFRGADFPGREEGAFLVAAVGDSLTLGEGVKEDDTYPSAVESALRGRGIDARVLNFGVNGYGLHDEVPVLEKSVLPYRPDLVLWEFYPDDISRQLVVEMGEKLGDLKDGCPFLNTPSRALNLISHGILRIYASRLAAAFYRETYDSPAYWNEMKNLLLRARDGAAASGGRLLVVMFPDLSALDGKRYRLEWVHRKVAAFLKESGIDAVDLTGAFQSYGPSRLYVHEVDHHPNEIAQRMAAGEIVRAMERLGLMPAARRDGGP